METDAGTPEISRRPVSLLFNVGEVQKRDVWDIDLVRILDILIGILETRGTTSRWPAGPSSPRPSYTG